MNSIFLHRFQLSRRAKLAGLCEPSSLGSDVLSREVATIQHGISAHFLTSNFVRPLLANHDTTLFTPVSSILSPLPCGVFGDCPVLMTHSILHISTRLATIAFLPIRQHDSL